jgi:hypothetical protein
VKVIAVGLALVGLLGACGETEIASPRSTGRSEAPSTAPEEPPLVRGTGTVLEEREGAPEFCLGGVATSLPPQCGGPRIEGWDWDAVEDEERAGGVVWGSYTLTGRYDGRTFLLQGRPRPPRYDDDLESDAEGAIASSCAEPDGGWAPGGDQNDVRSAGHYAQQQPEYAGHWVDHIGDNPDEFSPVILTAAFTGRLDEHEVRLRELWEGPLCVVEHERTLDDLQRIQRQLDETLDEELGYEMTHSDISYMENTVTLGVIYEQPGLREALDERFDEGVVTIEAALRPVG